MRRHVILCFNFLPPPPPLSESHSLDSFILGRLARARARFLLPSSFFSFRRQKELCVRRGRGSCRGESSRFRRGWGRPAAEGEVKSARRETDRPTERAGEGRGGGDHRLRSSFLFPFPFPFLLSFLVSPHRRRHHHGAHYDFGEDGFPR